MVVVFAGRIDAQIWSEEFNSGTAPDGDVWSCDLGAGGWGNSELQNYTSDPANVRVEDGNLVITAARQGNNFTSARIKTQDKLTFKYGTVEARIQTPDLGNGLWPAFWTMGNNHSSVGWPECGEIDVMEMGNASAISAGVVNRRVGSHAHWGSQPNHPNYGLSKDYATDIDDSFVTYRMEWTPSSISTFINDQWIWTMNISDIPEFHEPHFFILNLAVGGTYTGIYNAGGITAPFPAEYRIDYIRIFDNGFTELGGSSMATPPAPGTNLLANPGLESGTLAPWIGYAAGGANGLGGYVESTNSTYYNGGNPGGDSVLTHSGQHVAKVFGDFTGVENYNGFYQDLAAAPGSLWAATGWALTHPQDFLAGANTAWIEVSFRDAADAILSLYRSPLLTSANVVAGTWMKLEATEEVNPATGSVMGSTATMTAPSGTAKVRYQIVFRQTNDDGGSVYFDDLRLLEPVLPVMLSASIADGNIHLSFPTQNGVSYQTAYKSCLTNEVWNPIETIVGDGNTNSVSYPANDPVRFYGILTPSMEPPGN